MVLLPAFFTLTNLSHAEHLTVNNSY